MAQKKSAGTRKEIQAYKRARDRYMDACWAHNHESNKSDKTRRAWQEAMLDLLNVYSRTSLPRKLNPGIPLDWMPLADLSVAMRSVVDGKDTDLFFVTPSDRYDSHMIFAKSFAVGYIAKAETKEDQQTRKQWIMEQYGISRSTVNEWIKNIAPHDYDEEIEGSILGDMIDHYRENKLTGRRRKY